MSIIDILRSRERQVHSHEAKLTGIAEKMFAGGNFLPIDFPLSENVSSTISIAIAPDGKTVASTHGDHTVKVFDYLLGHTLRQFQGHPRTPWTVKYHPTDPNILASGCLGCQVRVWDIKQGICTSHIQFENSIISLSFHPGGQFIAVASGHNLQLWDWTRTANIRTDLSNTTIITPTTKLVSKQIAHCRNIRAVTFHPAGNFLLVAAPDPPKAPSALIPCRLYAIEFRQLFSDDQFMTQNEMINYPTLLPQIHLYSDGGLDLSADGRMLLSCAILLGAPTALVLSPFNTSPGDHEGSDHNDMLSSSPPSPTAFFTGRNDQLRSRLLSAFNFPDVLGDSDCSTASVGLGIHKSPPACRFRTTTVTLNPELRLYPGDVVPMELEDIDENSSAALLTTEHDERSIHVINKAGHLVMHIEHRHQYEPNPSPIASSSSLSSSGSPSTGRSARASLTPRAPVLLDPREEQDLPPGWKPEEYLCLFDISRRIESLAKQANLSLSTFTASEPLSPLASASSFTKGTSATVSSRPSKGANLSSRSAEDEHASVASSSSACVSSDEIKLVAYKRLPGDLMRTITSTKLSASGKYALLAFGVRNRHREVIDHENKYAACEIIELNPHGPKSSPRSISVVADTKDEVNIAQFHPDPGLGIVYGTKRGKVLGLKTCYHCNS